MESPEQFLGLSDHSRIIKRRRAHRLRRLRSPSSSPTMATSSSSSGGGDCSLLEVAGQDEDMANCLILLANGNGLATSDDRENAGEESGGRKSESSMVGSKKTSELSVVYECKTCNRVFPSFQALGGHRASHSKPSKGIGTLDDRNRTGDLNQDRSQIYRNTLSLNPALEISVGARPRKVHECLICGSEFASGQALGGHMRRHKSTGDDAAAGASIRWSDDINRKPRKLLSLDLNLPPPEGDDEGDSMFVYELGHPVQPLFISASALVDCYY